MGKTEEELDQINDYGASILNPFPAIGLFYLCKPCQEAVLPQKESLKNKNRTNAPPSQPSSQTSNSSQDRSSDLQGNTVPAQTSNANAGGTNVVPPQQQTTPPQHAQLNSNLNMGNGDGQNTANLDNDGTINHVPEICKHYRQGRCRHGISGKKDGTCAFQHPKPCPKLLANGTSRRGCTKGNRCTLFHPQMCHRSLKERICTRTDCHFWHIKGTKRVEHDYGRVTSANYEPMNSPNGNY